MMRDRQPWVRDRAEVERARRVVADGMVGRRIVGGRYFGLESVGEPEPMVRVAAGFHAVDYGLELDLDSGATWSFIWSTRSGYESVLAYEGELTGDQLVAGVPVMRIEDFPEWQTLIGQTVLAVAVDWEPFDDGVLCPNVWRISTDGGQIAITLGDMHPDGSPEPSADNIAVYFGVAGDGAS